MKTLRPLVKFFAFGFSICFFIGLSKGVISRFAKPTEQQVLSTIYPRVRVTEYITPVEPRSAVSNINLEAKSRKKPRNIHTQKTHDSNDGLVYDGPSAIKPPVTPVRIPVRTRQVLPLQFDYVCGDYPHFRYITSLGNRVDHVTQGEQYFESHSFMERMYNLEELGAFSAGLEISVVGKRVRVATGGRWPEIAGLVLGSFSGYFAGYAASEKYTLSCEDPAIVNRLSKPDEWATLIHAMLVTKCQSYGTVHNDTFIPLITDEKTTNKALGQINGSDKSKILRYLAEWQRAYDRASDKTIEMTSSDYDGCMVSQELFTATLRLNKVNVSLEERYGRLFMGSQEHKNSDLSDVLTFGNLLSLSIVTGVMIWGISSGATAVRSIVREGFKSDSK